MHYHFLCCADTVEQFHENGYFADPQTINELAQYWEDQRNIDSLLGAATGNSNGAMSHDAAATQQDSATHGHPGMNLALQANHATQQELPSTDKGQEQVEDEKDNKENVLGSLVNYSSSDEDP